MLWPYPIVANNTLVNKFALVWFIFLIFFNHEAPLKKFFYITFDGCFSCGGLNVRQVPTSRHRKSDVELCKVFSMMVNRWTCDKVKEMHIIRQRGCPFVWGHPRCSCS